jgi:hypothetical protein
VISVFIAIAKTVVPENPPLSIALMAGCTEVSGIIVVVLIYAVASPTGFTGTHPITAIAAFTNLVITRFHQSFKRRTFVSFPVLFDAHGNSVPAGGPDAGIQGLALRHRRPFASPARRELVSCKSLNPFPEFRILATNRGEKRKQLEKSERHYAAFTSGQVSLWGSPSEA